MEMHIDKIPGYSMEQLIPIVAELADRYTAGESASITYEKAQQLMGAVIYCLHECRERPSYETGYETGDEAGYETDYKIGYQIVLKKTSCLRELYNRFIGSFDSYGNRCLHETAALGMPEFLCRYDARFNPQETILTLDYPVLMDLSGLTGIDAVLEFGRCIAWEQEFLHSFDRRWVIDSLSAYSAEYKELVENLCSILLPGIVGHILLKKPWQENGYSAEEYQLLANGFAGHTKDGLKEYLRSVVRKLTLGIFGVGRRDGQDSQGSQDRRDSQGSQGRRDSQDRQNAVEYICGGIDELAVHIENALEFDCLEQVFRI